MDAPRLRLDEKVASAIENRCRESSSESVHKFHRELDSTVELVQGASEPSSTHHSVLESDAGPRALSAPPWCPLVAVSHQWSDVLDVYDQAVEDLTATKKRPSATVFDFSRDSHGESEGRRALHRRGISVACNPWGCHGAQRLPQADVPTITSDPHVSYCEAVFQQQAVTVTDRQATA